MSVHGELEASHACLRCGNRWTSGSSAIQPGAASAASRCLHRRGDPAAVADYPSHGYRCPTGDGWLLRHHPARLGSPLLIASSCGLSHLLLLRHGKCQRRA